MSALLPEGTKPAAPIPVTAQDLHVVVVDFGLAQMSSSSEPRFWVPALVGIGEHQETQEIGRLNIVKIRKNQPFGFIQVIRTNLGIQWSKFKACGLWI